jgi:RimJ/RimL family protein N-acetyltransferase
MTQRPDDSGPARLPSRIVLAGQYVFLAPLDPAVHGDALWSGTAGADNGDLWTYLADGPFPDRNSFIAALHDKAAAGDRVYFAIADAVSGLALGYAALMRIDVANRVIEVGSILYTRALQRTRGGTEAMYLLAQHVFEDLGYRRYEWKCNALNGKSRQAALRLGFTFEGIFRQHMIVKGLNRDTAWYSIIDSEWPARKAGFQEWLTSENFDASARQKRRLAIGGAT